ncbi:hypothetical protein ACFQGT_20145 [Natrialbaceae archaeon GCM10025810]|uniref:hypothetical protein n=1 Tax=Halovalidus salilacus TaxID=3075124 RepID=UPI00362370BC
MTTIVPVAIGYLLVGTIGLLATTPVLEFESITLPQVSHYYAVGFGAVLIYALGARLLIGFYHVTPSRVISWPTLLAGAVAPLLLGMPLWQEPWFSLGGVLGAVAMTGYLLLVGFVAVETDRSRVELAGILCGSLTGVAAVAVGLSVAFGGGIHDATTLHRTFVLSGFFPLTIVGYAYQFFPVTSGRFPGATTRGVAAAIGLLAVGVLVQGIGVVGQIELVRSVGIACSALGGLGYLYLVTGRFAGWSHARGE